MSKNELKKSILGEIEKRMPEFKGLLGDVIRIPTDNPPGDTAECVEFLAQHLRSKGLPADIYEPKKGSPNLVSYMEGEKSGPNLVLNGHIDQFPAGNTEDWSFDPYSGECRDGKILGRGVGDMKAGSVASLLCLQLMHELAIPIRGRLTLTLVSDEESGGIWGAKWLIDNVASTRGDSVLNSEPTGFDRILIGHKGKYWLNVKTSHPGGQAAMPVGEGAITQAMEVAEALKKLDGWKLAPPADAAHIIERSKAALEKRSETEGKSWVLDSTTVNVGVICGGIQPNTIPTRCTMDIDIRSPIGITTDRLKAEVEKVMRDAGLNLGEICCEWVVELECAYCSPDADIIRLLQANARQITGQDIEINVSFGSTDARFWWLLGIPAPIYGTNVFNIALPDEYVLESEFKDVLKVHAATIVDYLCE